MAYGIKGRVGRGGSGKTTFALRDDIIPALQKGRKVITNVPLLVENLELIHKIDPYLIKMVNMEEMKALISRRAAAPPENAGELANSLLVIDEIQEILPGGLNKTPFKEDAVKVVSWLRHDDCELVWMTQHYESVDKQFRVRTHIYCYHDDLGYMGVPRLRQRFRMPDMDGEPKEEFGAPEYYKQDWKINKCFKSAETGTHEKGTALKVRIPQKLIYAVVLFVGLLGWLGYDFIAKRESITNTLAGGSQMAKIQQKVTGGEYVSRVEPKDTIVAKVNGEICIHGLCTGYLDGVRRIEYSDTIKTVTRARPNWARASVLDGVLPPIESGNSTTLSGLSDGRN